ncbi:MAG: Nudix family hydrolase [Gammaproteobacteria bacterium]|nr:Nudix family hydrolase [Gammaproteobacteria bacterium]
MGTVRVAVAVIYNEQGEVLIQQRAVDTHQGGLWEFPGGKIEADETLEQALEREIREELDIDVVSSRPLITISHDYGDRHVSLEVYRVTEWHGQVQSMEQQPLHWVLPDRLKDYHMPAADKPIVSAINLSSSYIITPSIIKEPLVILEQLQALLGAGESMFLYRVKSLAGISHEAMQQEILELCNSNRAALLVHEKNRSTVKAHGVHLTEAGLQAYREKNDTDGLLSVSCHSAQSLQKAESINADFAMLSPVEKTQSHPDTKPLGWKNFKDIVNDVNIPVFALGGMTAEHKEKAWSHGAQGVAGISSWWQL